MITRTVTIGLIGLSATAAISQTPWLFQAPQPADRPWYAVHALSANHAWVAGNNRYVAETLDGGSTWKIHHAGPMEESSYRQVKFWDANHGVIAGDGLESLTTTDGGKTWKKNYDPNTACYVEDMQWLDSTHLVATYGGDILWSSDAGLTWTFTPPNQAINPYSMGFASQTLGLVSGYNFSTQEDGIFRTTNGGSNFTKVYDKACNVLMWTDSTRAIALSDIHVLRSTDSGATWNPIAATPDGNIVSWSRFSGTSVIIAISNSGTIWRSADLGVSWTKQFNGLGQGLWPNSWADISAAPDGGAWAAGDPSYVLRSSDQGLTWTLACSGIATSLGELDMFSATVGAYTGYPSFIFTTKNGGQKWAAHKLEVTGESYSRQETIGPVDFANSDTIICGGHGGVLFKTVDGGDSLTSIGYPVLNEFFRINTIEFITPLVGYVGGTDEAGGDHTQNLFKTTNGGASWTYLRLNTEPQFYQAGGIGRIHFIDENKGFIVGSNDKLVKTTNGGQTWTTQTLPSFQFLGLNQIRFRNAQEGFIVGGLGYLVQTTDGGQTWARINMNAGFDATYDVCFPGPNQIWVCGVEYFTQQGLLWKSSNNGSTWTREYSTPFPSSPTHISSAGGNVWLGGGNATIWEARSDFEIVRPSAFQVTNGSLRSGGLSSVQESDNSFLKIGKGAPGNNGLMSDTLIITATTRLKKAEDMVLEVESFLPARQNSEIVEMYNWQANEWERVQYHSMNTGKVRWYFRAHVNARRFIHPQTGEMRARLTAIQEVASDMSEDQFPHEHTIDLVQWKIQRPTTLEGGNPIGR